MPFAGWFLIRERGLGPEWLLLAGLFGAIGNVIGSVVAYSIGAHAGRPLLLKYGKYILLSRHDLEIAERFFARWGMWAVFLSRLLPVVRTFISFPAGVARMHLVPFIILTFVGSFPWSLGLAGAGFLLAERWERIRAVMRPLDIPILLILAALVIWYLYRHIQRAWTPAEVEPEVGQETLSR